MLYDNVYSAPTSIALTVVLFISPFLGFRLRLLAVDKTTFDTYKKHLEVLLGDLFSASSKVK